MGQASQKKYLTAAEVSQLAGGSPSTGTLANWRTRKPKEGPPYTKFGSRVLYPADKLEAWLESRTHANDNEPEQ